MPVHLVIDRWWRRRGSRARRQVRAKVAEVGQKARAGGDGGGLCPERARAEYVGLVVPGQPERWGFASWPSTVPESLWRIAAEWCARPSPLVGPGEIVWLAATPKSEEMARDIWRREGWT